MWCEKLNNGKYRFAERYLDPLTMTEKKVSVTLEKNTRQAQKTAQQALQEKIQQKLCVSDRYDVRLKDLVEAYRQDQEKTVKLSTYQRNYNACNSIMKILGEDIVLSKLTAGYIRSRFLSTGKKPVTLNEYQKRLKALLRWGYKNDFVDDIRYLDKLERFKDTPHHQKIEDKFLERSDLNLLVQGMSIELWRNLTMFLALSGLRFGEAAALLRSDLDFPEREIHVTKNYDGINHVVTTPKTYHSIRNVFMQDELYSFCRKLFVSGYIDHNIIRLNPGDLLFPYKEDKHISFDAYAKYLRENSERVLGRRITPHTLRHTHASLMMEQGVDIDTIAARLGHHDSKVTRDIYLHVTNRLDAERKSQMKKIRILAP